MKYMFFQHLVGTDGDMKYICSGCNQPHLQLYLSKLTLLPIIYEHQHLDHAMWDAEFSWWTTSHTLILVPPATLLKL